MEMKLVVEAVRRDHRGEKHGILRCLGLTHLCVLSIIGLCFCQD